MKIRDIKFMTDENISPKLVTFLRQQEIDVLDVKEQKLYGMDDEEILDIAFQEQRFIITHDSDFGTLAVNEGKRFFGIIYIRLRNQNYRNIIRVFEKLLRLDTAFFPGTILVVEETRIRIKYTSEKC